MKKSYLIAVIIFSLFACTTVIGCKSQNQSANDIRMISDLATVEKNDFILLKDGKLMIVHNINCESHKPECRLTLKSGHEASHELIGWPLEWWAPKVEMIVRFIDDRDTYAFAARKYLNNQ